LCKVAFSIDGHAEVSAGLSEAIARVLQVRLGVCKQSSIIGVQQFTNQHACLAFSAQPEKAEQPAPATSVKHYSVFLWESMGEKSSKTDAEQCRG